MSELGDTGQAPEYITPRPPDIREVEGDPRKESVVLLTSELLAKRNQGIDKTDVALVLRSLVGVYSGASVEESLTEANEKLPGLKNVDDAMLIARYYLESGEPVPGAVSICTGKDREFDVDPIMKSLVFVDDEKYAGEGRVHDKIMFEETDKNVAPDIYVANLNIRPDTVFRAKQEIDISGFDNVLFGAEFGRLVDDRLRELDITCTGNIVMMDGSRLVGQTYNTHGGMDLYETFNVNLKTSGDVILFPNSVLGATNIHCNNFIQEGGELVLPTMHERLVRYREPTITKIHCDTEAQLNGGKRDPRIIIKGADERRRDLERIAEGKLPDSNANTQDNKPTNSSGTVEEVSTRNENAFVDMDRMERPSSRDELSEAFDDLEAPQTKLLRDDGENGIMEVRGYDLTNLSSGRRTELTTYAAISGWKILVGTAETLVVQRKQHASSQKE